MRPDALARGHRRGPRAAGIVPIAVVATVGTTSTTSVDPVRGDRGDLRARGDLAARRLRPTRGVAAIVPEYRHILDGVRARRLAGGQPAQVAVHAVRPQRVLLPAHGRAARRRSRSRPSTCRTAEAGAVKNLMDTGVQLGRRFRALKLWMILRYFGAEGLRARLSEHMRLARLFAGWVDADPDFERLAPVPFSVVCFRAKPRGRRVDRGRTRGAQPAAARRDERDRRGVPVAHEAGRPVHAPARGRQPADRASATSRARGSWRRTLLPRD